MNRELAFRVADRIERKPERFDMSWWATCLTKYVLDEVFDTVSMTGQEGTAYVTPEIRELRKVAIEVLNGAMILDVETAAQELLGLPDTDLFYRTCWPRKYREMARTGLPEHQAKAAVAYLRALASREPEPATEEELVTA